MHWIKKLRMCQSKRLYLDEASAAQALKSPRRGIGPRQYGGRRAKVALRSYQCPLCKGWHLTSK